VLGPLLFLLYINDIEQEINSQIRLFADDCILYRTIKSPSDSVTLQQVISKLKLWSDQWQMSFNQNKCHILSVSRQKGNVPTSYKLGNTILSQVDSYPYLGVTISSDLKWNKHIENISAKASCTLNFIKQNIYHCTTDAKTKAYLSLVRPCLEFASSAWDPYLAKDIECLDKIQRRAARFVCRDYRHTTSVSGLIEKLGWQPLTDRRKIARLVHFYKIVNKTSPIEPDSLCKPSRSTRSTPMSNNVISIFARTDSYKFFFSKNCN